MPHEANVAHECPKALVNPSKGLGLRDAEGKGHEGLGRLWGIKGPWGLSFMSL